MGFKKKVLGTLAAAALTLSMFGGVAADAPGKAELIPTVCSAGPAYQATNGDLGQWKYNGHSGYELVGSDGVDNVINVGVNVRVPSPGATCVITFDTDGLEYDGDSIDRSHFNVRGITDRLTHPFKATFTNQTVGHKTFEVKLHSVPNNVDTGLYEGTITTTVESGQ